VGKIAARPLHWLDGFAMENYLTDGGLAERLRSGLQIREDRFDSDTRLQWNSVYLIWAIVIPKGGALA
jgi:hypothetical protein